MPYRMIAATMLAIASAATVAGDTGDFSSALARWETVLQRFVDGKGRIDFEALAAERGDLDAFVDWIARVSPATAPELFPTPQHVLAYHINAYNALAMQGVVDAEIPDGFGSFFDRLRFFKLRSVTIGGVKTSLHDYENKVIRPLGEPRVHFALNCMVRDCPRLPREPFRPETLDAQLEAAAREFFSKERHLRIDHEKGEIWVSEILDFYTEDFTGNDDPQGLVFYVNRYLADPVPVDYRVRFIRYDWTLNRQPPRG